MSFRICSCRRTGFSLIELLTVVSIIALLVGILVPALNVVNRRAKVAATQNTISVLETGIETFRADTVVGGAYPESAMRHPKMPQGVISPVTNQPARVSGASLLLWALAGADLMGSPGFGNLDGNETWRDNTGSAFLGPNFDLYAVDGMNNRLIHSRSGPFVSVESMKFPKEVLDRSNRFLGYDLERYPIPDVANLLASRCFLDAFGRPILYYRANPAGTGIAGLQDFDGTLKGSWFYDLHDNYVITGVSNRNGKFGPMASNPGLNLGGDPEAHPIAQLGNPANPTQTGIDPSPKYSFTHVLWDPNVTVLYRPHRPDSFILLSAGPDGRYGTYDDVGNFPIKK